MVVINRQSEPVGMPSGWEIWAAQETAYVLFLQQWMLSLGDEISGSEYDWRVSSEQS